LTEATSDLVALILLTGHGITMKKFSEQQIHLLKEPLIAQLVTIMKDGSPQISPAWVDVDSAGEHILINSVDGRLKLRNIHRDPRVAVGIYDPENPISRALNVRGRVLEITNDGAYDHMDFLAEKYTGKRPYDGHNPENPRLILKIAADQIDSTL
jgi:PPOX class probable F420-dependent enzyme